MSDHARQFAEAMLAAFQAGSPIRISGSGSKAFYTGNMAGDPLDVTLHQGIVNYEPSELVLTARAGTSLRDIEALLAQHGQMLAFEPPHFGPGATLGGAVACGFSGPRRPYCGSLRDFILGARIINGKGEILQFGGQVMKNVAGFDVSRLMAGSLGTLGILLEVSFKVLPLPSHELTLQLPCNQAEAILLCADWGTKPLPISAAAWLDGLLHVRLSGYRNAVEAMAQHVISGSMIQSDAFWPGLREHRLAFFDLYEGESLWRLSLPPATPPLDLNGRTCLDWGGAQRWLASTLPPAEICEAARRAGGYAIVFRTHSSAPAHSAMVDPAIAALQRRIRHAFDPAGILNPGVHQGVL